MPGNALTSIIVHLHVDTHPGTQIWDLKTYKLKTDLPGHTDEVYCVDFVADKLVSGGRDRTVKMCALFLSSSLFLPKSCGKVLIDLALLWRLLCKEASVL